jgi:hypothetical protein
MSHFSSGFFIAVTEDLLKRHFTHAPCTCKGLSNGYFFGFLTHLVFDIGAGKRSAFLPLLFSPLPFFAPRSPKWYSPTVTYEEKVSQAALKFFDATISLVESNFLFFSGSVDVSL